MIAANLVYINPGKRLSCQYTVLNDDDALNVHVVVLLQCWHFHLMWFSLNCNPLINVEHFNSAWIMMSRNAPTVVQCMLNFCKCHSVLLSLKCKPAFCNFGVGVCIQVAFRLGLLFTSLKNYIILYKLGVALWPLMPVFLARSDGEVYKKGAGHFVVHIESGMNLTSYISGLLFYLHPSLSH